MKVKCESAVEFTICDTCPHSDEHEKDINCTLTYCVHSKLTKVNCYSWIERRRNEG